MLADPVYAGDARLGPALAESLQAYVPCNLLADQPLTLAQAGEDAARAFWVAPSPNRLRAYGNALPRPPALQLPALAKTHAHEMPVQYPQRPEFEAAKSCCAPACCCGPIRKSVGARRHPAHRHPCARWHEL